MKFFLIRLISTLGIAAFVWLVGVYLEKGSFSQYLHPNYLWLNIFFTVLYLITNFIESFSQDKTPQKSPLYFLAGMAVRLLLSSAFVAIIVFNSINQPKLFVFNFALIYLIFLVFEITTLLTTLQRNLKRQSHGV